MITVQWDDDSQQTIRFDIIGRWTWDEYYQVVHQMSEMIKGMEQTIDVMVDFSRSSGIPIGAISKTRESFALAPSNSGLVVFAAGSALVNTMVFAFRKAQPKWSDKLVTAPSLDAARELLKQRHRIIS
ncbi:MAG: hypothetical protein GC204_19580 [Chloroflexi bacterium]|nr:hypothetical protein [Chloroflexota bacterium]